jgi:exopolyphosphatase/pppGpp-phosphohydrolase
MDELEDAAAIADKATEDTVEEMERKGWRRCSEAIGRSGAIVEISKQLGDSDYCVAATKTGGSYFVWVLDWKE